MKKEKKFLEKGKIPPLQFIVSQGFLPLGAHLSPKEECEQKSRAKRKIFEKVHLLLFKMLKNGHFALPCCEFAVSS